MNNNNIVINNKNNNNTDNKKYSNQPIVQDDFNTGDRGRAHIWNAYIVLPCMR